MYAIVQIGSSQFKVAEGDVIEPLRLKGDKGEKYSIDKVLMFTNGKDIRIGQPYLDDVKIEAKIVEHTLESKVIAFKYRRRKDSHTKKGHRQQHTALSITKISG